MSKDDIERIALKKFWETRFEKLWKELKTKNPRTRMIAKTTRKYIAQLFFLDGLRAGLELTNAKLTEIVLWAITLSKEPAERLRKRFLAYAQKLGKEEPDLAKRIEEKVDELVAWYVTNKRDMTPAEFNKIIGDVKT